MLTDTARGQTAARRFVLRAMAGSLGFFCLLRFPWTETHVVLPLTRAQGALAAGLFGTSTSPVEATLACSGADVLALCLGAILAYPVTWRSRLAGAMGGTALILALNTVRIGTLGRVSASPAWFNALHLYIWPALLTLVIAGFVFAWMRSGDPPPLNLPPSLELRRTRRRTSRGSGIGATIDVKEGSAHDQDRHGGRLALDSCGRRDSRSTDR